MATMQQIFPLGGVSLANPAYIYFGNSPETTVPTQPSAITTYYLATTGLTFSESAYFNNTTTGLTGYEATPVVSGGLGVPTSPVNFGSNRSGDSPEGYGSGNFVVRSSRQITDIAYTYYTDGQVVDVELLDAAGNVDTTISGAAGYIYAYQTSTINVATYTATAIYGIRFNPYFLSLNIGLFLLSQLTFTFA